MNRKIARQRTVGDVPLTFREHIEMVCMVNETMSNTKRKMNDSLPWFSPGMQLIPIVNSRYSMATWRVRDTMALSPFEVLLYAILGNTVGQISNPEMSSLSDHFVLTPSWVSHRFSTQSQNFTNTTWRHAPRPAAHSLTSHCCVLMTSHARTLIK